MNFLASKEKPIFRRAARSARRFLRSPLSCRRRACRIGKKTNFLFFCIIVYFIHLLHCINFHSWIKHFWTIPYVECLFIVMRLFFVCFELIWSVWSNKNWLSSCLKYVYSALRKFPKWKLPKWKFPNENFPKWSFPKSENIPRVKISQVLYKEWKLPNFFPENK